MQSPLTSSLPSLSSSHPINGTQQAQRYHNEATGIAGDPTSPSSLPPPLPPPVRNAKRHSNTANNQKAAQLAKQEIRGKLREDWSWPPTAGTPCSHQAVNLPTEDSAWLERGDGFDTESDEAVAVDPYHYENPDALMAAGAEAAGSAESRKRKRQRVLLEEMEWNEGLRHFVERRDAWSGARKQQSPPAITDRSSGDGRGGRRRDPSRKRNAIYAPPGAAANGFAESLFDRSSPPPPPPPQTPSTTFVPLAPPILPPDNAVRASITPATYPSIYSKIVIQGLTPTVPINLNDVVGALVQGWKDNDEWPPKSEAERAGMADGADGVGDLASTGVKNGVRRGMGKVKKALGLSGSVEEDGGEREVRVNEEPNDLRGFDGRYD